MSAETAMMTKMYSRYQVQPTSVIFAGRSMSQ